ncbi:hypothetical protein [Ferruginibacter profundus]
MHCLPQYFFLIVLFGLTACANPTNKRAVSIDELDSIQAEDRSTLEQLAPKQDMLNAAALVQLAECNDLSCVQLFMKNHTTDFVQGYKGEFNAAKSITIRDSSGNELTMPASTFYVDVNPQASWRTAHTVHTKKMADSLLNEFKELGFEPVDKDHLPAIDSKDRYVSERYPGTSLYVTPSFHPWYFKGLYKDSVTWLCYIFEVYKSK